MKEESKTVKGEGDGSRLSSNDNDIDILVKTPRDHTISLTYYNFNILWYTSIASQMLRNSRHAFKAPCILLPKKIRIKTDPHFSREARVMQRSRYIKCETKNNYLSSKNYLLLRKKNGCRRAKEEWQDSPFNPFSHFAAWPIPLHLHLACVCVCVSVKWVIIRHSPQQPRAQGLPRSGYVEEQRFTLGCLSLRMCTCMCVHDNKDSLVCLLLLRGFISNLD